MALCRQKFRISTLFRNALKGETGRFNSIGSATNEPDYFIAQPVYPIGTSRGEECPIGVIAVKISLARIRADLEQQRGTDYAGRR